MSRLINEYLEQSLQESKNVLQSIENELKPLKVLKESWTHWCDKYGDNNMELNELPQVLDCKLRFEMFIIATHYWESRFLLDLQDRLSSGIAGRSKPDDPKPWSWYAKVTPCFVSTFYMLPKFFCNEKDDVLDKIDLLIVDEAGQVSPEIGGAGFALAKKALIVGDILQIEPIVSISNPVDNGNLQECGIMRKGAHSPEASAFKEFMSSTRGSVMIIGQRASYYQVNEDERGMFLSEHRRCVPEIIAYCNELAYHGKLQPKRKSIIQRTFPALGYAHIPGKADRVGSSRKNELEAEVIVKWIIGNREMLLGYSSEERNRELKKDKKLDEVVGIITPFSAQERLIQKKLKEKNIEGITVGTIHKLQGAERKIVIFSPVYDSQDVGFIFDRGKNMLNVAVSRAKDSFLVFGKMDIFQLRAIQESRILSPSALLAKYLFADEKNEIDAYQYIDPALLYTGKTCNSTEIKRLATLEEHRNALKRAFEEAKQKVHIVSPYLKKNALEADIIPDQIRMARSRGVQVVLYFDDSFTQNDGYLKKALSNAGAEVKTVKRVHNKTLCVDDRLLIEGSFNWLSASRDPFSGYQRHEVSLCYEGVGVHEMVQQAINEIEARLLS